jgi:ABC-2 type transport system ATP-binding protein
VVKEMNKRIGTPENSQILSVDGLVKQFGSIKATNEVQVKIKKGEIFSLLGPNGAGKSTIIRILTTILTPDMGNVRINGISLSDNEEKSKIRKIIGVCPQDITIYEELTAEENVVFIAQMHGIPKFTAKNRAHELLSQLGLGDRKDKVRFFSGGMKRRLNLAMALVHHPEIAFLDEPTAGLDPQARRIVWDFIRSLRTNGMTVFLTTHDMVEADELSDNIAIIDNGKIIAEGTPTQLKNEFGGNNIIDIEFLQAEEISKLIIPLQQIKDVVSVKLINQQLIIAFHGGLTTFLTILKKGFLDILSTDVEKQINSIKLHQNNLEDVFLQLTGRRLRE